MCEPDYPVKTDAPSATPNDPLYNQQWNMAAIKLPTVWQAGQFGDPQRQVSNAPDPGPCIEPNLSADCANAFHASVCSLSAAQQSAVRLSQLGFAQCQA